MTRDHLYMLTANHLDFLDALDRHTRDSPLGEVTVGYDMHAIARDASLVEPGDLSAARWTGELVDLGYVTPTDRPGRRRDAYSRARSVVE